MNFTFPTNAGKKKNKAQRIVIFHKHYRSNDFPNFEGSKKRECEASCPRLLSVLISQSSLTGNRFLKASLNLTVQGTLKSLLQHHSSKAVLWHSAFFMDQLSHPYMTTGETIVLTRRTFVSKVMSVLFFFFCSLYCHLFFSFFFFLFVVNSVIHWNEKALGSHVFPICLCFLICCPDLS